MSNTSALILDIDHFAVHDGPGIRTSIYFKGCPLSCQWCHSPESQSCFPELFFIESRCTACGRCGQVCPGGLHKIQEGIHCFSRENCDVCGMCANVCPRNALVAGGKKYTLEEVLKEALSDRVFYNNSGGGVTLTGGEVLSQGPFVLLLLEKLKKQKIHTIVETSGFGREEYLLAMADLASLFYFDFKLADPKLFLKFIGQDPARIWRNLEYLRQKTAAIVLRMPIIPGITDTPENITALYKLAKELNIVTVHLLPYNNSAGAKYEWVGKNYTLSCLKQLGLPEDLLQLEHPGVKVEIIR